MSKADTVCSGSRVEYEAQDISLRIDNLVSIESIDDFEKIGCLQALTSYIDNALLILERKSHKGFRLDSDSMADIYETIRKEFKRCQMAISDLTIPF